MVVSMNQHLRKSLRLFYLFMIGSKLCFSQGDILMTQKKVVLAQIFHLISSDRKRFQVS